MKTMIINASPRKNWNTAQLLKEAAKGAEFSGAEVEYVDLYDLSFTGCRSCLACKRQGAERCKCYWKDDLSPLIDRILASDALIIGTPIYFGEATSGFRALVERLLFCIMSYDGDGAYFQGKIKTGILYTMNAPAEYYEAAMRQSLRSVENLIGILLKGGVRTYAACDTVQVSDYSKYNMAAFNEEYKKAQRDEQFPADLKAAFDLGAELSR
ncbi:MAG: flavodoxin family protein [Clostridia bacterium]|nr:flavodoxin family protein [Clostridia bacterium]